MMLLDEYEKNELAKFIEKHAKEGKPTRYLVEVIPQSMSTDVKISNISDENLHIQTTDVTSLIDWENYDF